MAFRRGDWVRYTFPQCAPQEAVVDRVHAGGKTLAVMPQGHPPSLPALWVEARVCVLVERSE